MTNCTCDGWCDGLCLEEKMTNDEEKEVLELAKSHVTDLGYIGELGHSEPVFYEFGKDGLLAFAQAIRDQEAAKRIMQLSSITATSQKWHDLAVSIGFDGVAEAIGSVHDITKERDDLRQRILKDR